MLPVICHLSHVTCHRPTFLAFLVETFLFWGGASAIGQGFFCPSGKKRSYYAVLAHFCFPKVTLVQIHKNQKKNLKELFKKIFKKKSKKKNNNNNNNKYNNKKYQKIQIKCKNDNKKNIQKIQKPLKKHNFSNMVKKYKILREGYN